METPLKSRTARPPVASRVVDISRSATQGMPRGPCYSAMYTHSPHAAYISLWGPHHQQQGPGRAVRYGALLMHSERASLRHCRMQMLEARGLWVAHCATTQQGKAKREMRWKVMQQVECAAHGDEEDHTWERRLDLGKSLWSSSGAEESACAMSPRSPHAQLGCLPNGATGGVCMG